MISRVVHCECSPGFVSVLILIFAMFCQRKRVEYLLDDPMYDDGVRENVVAYDEEGAG